MTDKQRRKNKNSTPFRPKNNQKSQNWSQIIRICQKKNKKILSTSTDPPHVLGMDFCREAPADSRWSYWWLQSNSQKTIPTKANRKCQSVPTNPQTTAQRCLPTFPKRSTSQKYSHGCYDSCTLPRSLITRSNGIPTPRCGRLNL